MRRGIASGVGVTMGAALLVSALVVSCDAKSSDKGAESTAPASGAGGGTTQAEPPKEPGFSELPVKLDSNASGVAVGDAGVYVLDFGKNNELSINGYSSGSDAGRLLLLPGGDGAQEVVAEKVGAPSGVAVGPDGSVYVVDQSNDKVMRFDKGSKEPVELPFTGEDPKRVAVSAAGDVVVLVGEGVEVLRKGETTPQAFKSFFSSGDALAISPEGAIYFTDTFDTMFVVDEGATEPRELYDPDESRTTSAMAFDAKGDRYVVEELSTTETSENGRKTVTTINFTLRKAEGDTEKSTEIPVEGLTLDLPTGLAVTDDAFYISDFKRVVKVPRS